MARQSTHFAEAFDNDFRKRTRGLSSNEVPLFRALHSTLVGLSPRFAIEEYHGAGHQVVFTGDGTYARTAARCELSDLMILTYSPQKKHIRLTYLQVKSERATLSSPNSSELSANLEQWFLLSRRPSIQGVGSKFNPPHDLLAGALLSSIGSFAFLYRDCSGNFQVYYASAHCLRPASTYATRYGKLIVLAKPCHQMAGGTLCVRQSNHDECMIAFGNRPFATKLFDMKIGTPIDLTAGKVSQQVREWLAINLTRLIEKRSGVNHPLALEIIDMLQPQKTSDRPPSVLGAKEILIIRSGEVDDGEAHS
ncbi:MAG: hypothetical protein A4E65_00817 [Syntrophorhabdus sp. PtaU1.Bin153]|nr:MAG: hypothetical protein A4E65_00817 [Syntrophorhabdus sp. PtaU1.Bin153]